MKASLAAISILTFVAVGTSSRAALGWNAAGHEAVAHLAERNLSSGARARIQQLLGEGTSLASVSTWADEIKQQRSETSRWHYIDIDVRANVQKRDIPRSCPSQDCVTARIEIAARELNDVSLSHDARVESLKFLVHFVGDLHQPLHCADDADRGGNDKRLLVPGSDEPMKLHAYWDNLPAMHTGEDARALADRLEKRITATEKAAWMRGNVTDWAWESFGIARRFIYPDFTRGRTRSPVPLPARYQGPKARQIVETQLSRAGVRLASLLNAAFQR
ncbi:MAG: S1/P1 nuclease [Myxococcota bacterium]